MCPDGSSALDLTARTCTACRTPCEYVHPHCEYPFPVTPRPNHQSDVNPHRHSPNASSLSLRIFPTSRSACMMRVRPSPFASPFASSCFPSVPCPGAGNYADGTVPYRVGTRKRHAHLPVRDAWDGRACEGPRDVRPLAPLFPPSPSPFSRIHFAPHFLNIKP
jgi:hypothetical protein